MQHATNKSSLLSHVKNLIPVLSNDLHKGSSGKVGIVGGSLEYTGAPYFAAIASLRAGADLAHVFCTQAAGSAIKSYSPDLIVHPLLPSSDEMNIDNIHTIADKIIAWLPSLHGLIIGPGLSRNANIIQCTKRIIEAALHDNLPVVIDGDGISAIVCKWPSLIHGNSKVVLTPNLPEYKRLCKSVNCNEDTDIIQLCKMFGNITIVQKGAIDKISNGDIVIDCDEQGSPRRCGGQGDLTAGFIGTFLTWQSLSENKQDQSVPDIPGPILAGYAGCLLTRTCGQRAYLKYKRSMLTADMIDEIGSAFNDLFEV